jgi:hypothetical protein
MKHILILLFLLAAFPAQADNTPKDGDSRSADSASKSDNSDTSKSADSASKSKNGKKPKQGGEEEPDCE